MINGIHCTLYASSKVNDIGKEYILFDSDKSKRIDHIIVAKSDVDSLTVVKYKIRLKIISRNKCSLRQ